MEYVSKMKSVFWLFNLWETCVFEYGCVLLMSAVQRNDRIEKSKYHTVESGER